MCDDGIIWVFSFWSLLTKFTSGLMHHQCLIDRAKGWMGVYENLLLSSTGMAVWYSGYNYRPFSVEMIDSLHVNYRLIPVLVPFNHWKILLILFQRTFDILSVQLIMTRLPGLFVWRKPLNPYRMPRRRRGTEERRREDMKAVAEMSSWFKEAAAVVYWLGEYFLKLVFDLHLYIASG